LFAALHDPVNALGAAVAWDSEARNSSRHAEAVNLLLNGHEGEDVVDALFRGEIGVLKRIFIMLLREERSDEKEGNGEGGRDVTLHQNGATSGSAHRSTSKSFEHGFPTQEGA